jgi:hypothetical protein
MILLGCCRKRNCELLNWSGHLNTISFIVVVANAILSVKVADETDMGIVP